MKVKAVIMRPDHQNKTAIITEKMRQGKTFRVDERTYMMDDDYFQITEARDRFGRKESYITYYYREGTPSPLPVPDFEEIATIGISSEELAAIFNPWFYRTIAPKTESWQERLMLILACVNAAAAVFIIWRLGKIMEAVAVA
jgi:hypothetical protein